MRITFIYLHGDPDPYGVKISAAGVHRALRRAKEADDFAEFLPEEIEGRDAKHGPLLLNPRSVAAVSEAEVERDDD